MVLGAGCWLPGLPALLLAPLAALLWLQGLQSLWPKHQLLPSLMRPLPLLLLSLLQQLLLALRLAPCPLQVSRQHQQPPLQLQPPKA
jgi:hypothetical protein